MVNLPNKNNVRDAFGATPQASLQTLQHAPAAGPAEAAVNGETPDFVGVIFRVLRGRYRLTVALVMLAGTFGAAAGWFWAGPLYHSGGMVRIASALPAVIQQTDQNQPIPMFESFMQAQQELVTSQGVLKKALQNPIWNSRALSDKRPTIANLAAGLKVDVQPKSENIRISYVDRIPAVASAAVASTISAYQSVFEQDDQQLEQQRLQLLQDYRSTLVKQVDLGKVAVTPTKNSPTPLPAQVQKPVAEQLSADRLAMIDPVMRRMLDDRDRAKDQLDEATIDYGRNYPYVLHLTLTYQRASERANQYLNDYVAFHAATANNAPAPVLTAPMGETAKAAPAGQLSASMQQLQTNLDDVNQRIEMLKTEAAMPKRFKIVDAGDIPAPLPGRQIKWTMTGGAVGGGLALGIMVVLGLFQTRFRVCADVIENIGRKLRFVAVVPNLDASSKPRHWADAAQCIHYLRHRLDQNGSAVMVTSADWSEGRTSVSMSLAVSLCGSGARTLVIDADLATRGLTRALKMDNRPGLYEMLRDGDSVVPQKAPNDSIAILPVGAANEADGVSISAPAVARLLERLKKQYDVVLIDAGPALWRVETCVMAREVDGVLLTICRGQKQSLWAKTLDELESVANVYGAVFNRVEPGDFDRSVLRRSGAQGIGQQRSVVGPLENFGPLVQAVAVSLPQDIRIFPVGSEATFGARKVA